MQPTHVDTHTHTHISTPCRAAISGRWATMQGPIAPLLLPDRLDTHTYILHTYMHASSSPRLQSLAVRRHTERQSDCTPLGRGGPEAHAHAHEHAQRDLRKGSGRSCYCSSSSTTPCRHRHLDAGRSLPFGRGSSAAARNTLATHARRDTRPCHHLPMAASGQDCAVRSARVIGAKHAHGHGEQKESSRTFSPIPASPCPQNRAAHLGGGMRQKKNGNLSRERPWSSWWCEQPHRKLHHSHGKHVRLEMQNAPVAALIFSLLPSRLRLLFFTVAAPRSTKEPQRIQKQETASDYKLNNAV